MQIKFQVLNFCYFKTAHLLFPDIALIPFCPNTICHTHLNAEEAYTTLFFVLREIHQGGHWLMHLVS